MIEQNDLIKKLDHEWGLVVHDAYTEIRKLLDIFEAAETMLEGGGFIGRRRYFNPEHMKNLRRAMRRYRRFRANGGGEVMRKR